MTSSIAQGSLRCPLSFPYSPELGSAVASAGDVNGDGYADVLVAARGIGYLDQPGAVYLFPGGPAGLTALPIAINDPGNVLSVALGN